MIAPVPSIDPEDTLCVGFNCCSWSPRFEGWRPGCEHIRGVKEKPTGGKKSCTLYESSTVNYHMCPPCDRFKHGSQSCRTQNQPRASASGEKLNAWLAPQRILAAVRISVAGCRWPAPTAVS